MKRYLLFAGYAYYPGGGMHDFYSSHDTAEDAKNAAMPLMLESDGEFSWWHVFDRETGQIVSGDGYSCSVSGSPDIRENRPEKA